jgi:hypothetical protein
MMVQGFIEDIEEIWKNGFKFNRERKFVPSCKTISGIEKLCLSNEEYEYIKNKPIDENLFDKFIKPKQKENVIFVYGVVNPKNNDWNTPTVYGVTDPKINLTDIENLKTLSNIQTFLNGKNKNDEENN